jgi:DNA-binding MarR family transcriptional regulator
MKPDIPLGGLVSIIHRSHIIYLNSELKKFGIAASGFLILMHLSHEQNVIQEDLARHFHIDKSTIARAVRKLENAGFIRRVVYSGNRRASHLFLTEKGEKIIPEIARIDTVWEEMALSSSSEEERSQAYSLLGRMAKKSLMIAGNCGE